ncbi:MAG: helix-turn-helix transcriptional regulator [Pseudonocardiaceae bacterium]
MDPLGPEFLDSDEVRAAVEALDIGALFRLAQRLGVTQRKIAELTDQSQSEVCAILKGRKVVNFFVLRRIADGFGISRARMFLGYGEEGPQAPSTGREVDAEVRRRAVIAALLNEPFVIMGEPIMLGMPTTTHDSLPTRLGMVHVRVVRTVTEQLRGLARYCGGQGDQFAVAVARHTRWMEVPGTDEVKSQLAAALAELHTEAGWACYDSGLDGTGYFTHGLPLAHQAGDTYAIANAAWQVGLTLVRSGYPNDALAMFQLGGFWARKPTPRGDDPRLPTLTARLTRGSATAYALMGGTDEATRHLAEAHDEWEPRDAFERAGADLGIGGIQLDLGQLDSAEQFATNAVRTFDEGRYRRGRTLAQLLLAEVYVRAGEPQGLILARHAIAEVSTLQSVPTRRERLIPLATALEARPGTDTQELARAARQVATTRI